MANPGHVKEYHMPQSLINGLLLCHLFGLLMAVRSLPIGEESTAIGVYILAAYTAAVFLSLIVAKRIASQC